MFDAFNIHGPLLVNTVGHSVGLLLFSALLFLLFEESRSESNRRGRLAAVAATLALLWNAGSLVVLAASSGFLPPSHLVASLSFAVLSLLPAVLLHIALDGRLRGVWVTGYVISALGVAFHLAELAEPDIRFHQAALWVISAGFGLLTSIALFATRKAFPGRTAMSMCLFLFAISFVHFGPGDVQHAWSSEIALHHAGIPLALYVLLQDYRFLLLDTYLRFFVNGLIAATVTLTGLVLNFRLQLIERAAGDSFLQGVLIVGACVVLALMVVARARLQVFLTRVVFSRPDREPVISEIRAFGASAMSEKDFLDGVVGIPARFIRAAQSSLVYVPSCAAQDVPVEPMLVTGSGQQPSWVEVVVPLRFMKGDGALLLLGRREGGRRYLSEDLRELSLLAAVIVEQVERYRNSETQRLVSQAELRALQSQINPHFLFNSLNTLYGSIPREASEARAIALNLAEMFRYFLRSNRTFVPLSEEIHIVRAYLQIESLRLGERLKTEIVIDPSARDALIPVLSIQPLIENAVKHGVSPRLAPGTVRLSARVLPQGIRIEVSDNGGGFHPASERGSALSSGIGLDNVRQRLKLCYGPSADLHIASTNRGCTVAFLIPAQHAFPLKEGIA